MTGLYDGNFGNFNEFHDFKELELKINKFIAGCIYKEQYNLRKYYEISENYLNDEGHITFFY